MKPHFTLKFFGIMFASWVKFLVLPDQSLLLQLLWILFFILLLMEE